MTTAPRYRLLARWASGGMADIYVARQQGFAGFDKLVALKFLRDVGDTPAIREMFLDEVRTAALLNHPNIVQTFDADTLGDRLFLAMEFVHGEPLNRFARHVIAASGAFPVELAVAIARDLANALDHAHSLTTLDGTPLELVHRDVSPSNVLLSFDGMVKLLDFGIAKVANRLESTGSGIIKGKFSYMAPEQVRGQPVDGRTDIYALGIVLWQLLTGRAAFEATTDPELLRLVANPLIAAPSVAGAKTSEALDEIVMTALSPRPDDRYATAGEFATALSRYLTRHAAGFDATRLIRGLMKVHFADRRDRVAALVRGTEVDLAVEQLDELIQQPSLRTPVDEPAPVPTAVEPSSPVSAIAPAPRSRTRRWPWAIAISGGLVAGVLGARAIVDDAPSPIAIEPPRELPPPVAVATVPIERAPVEHAPDLAPAPAPARVTVVPGRPQRTTIATPPRIAKPPPVRSRPDEARAGGSGSARAGSGSGAATAGSGSARIAAIVPSEVSPAPLPTVTDRAPVPTPARVIGSLDAIAGVARVNVTGSLPTSEIQSALERTTGQLRECYRVGARRARQTPALTIRVSFVIDEARAPRGVAVAGDPIGLTSCVREAIANIRTRSAPDVGTVSVVAQIRFKPTP